MGASNYNYHVPEQDAWKTRSNDPADKFIDSLDATSALHLAQRAIASEEEKAATAQFLEDEQTFRAMWPSYKDSTHNAKEMRLYWETALGTTIPSLEQIEESFFELRKRGVLNLNAAAVARESEEEILRRAAELREQREARAFDEADAYTMDFAELERRARAGW